MEFILLVLILALSAKTLIMIPGYLMVNFYIRWKKSNEINTVNILKNVNNTDIISENETESRQTFKEKLIIIAEGFLWYSMAYTGRIPSHVVRNFLYRYVYQVNFEKKAVIYNSAELRDPFKVKIGKGSIIGNRAILDARRGGITIGDNVNISTGVWLWTGKHDHQDPYFRSIEGKRGPIVIKDRAWLGPRVTVLHSVTIGEGAVVAAGAVVTKDVEPFSIYAGIPAKKIGERNQNLKYEFDGIYIPFY